MQCVERSLEMVVGLMAILAAGGVYCPVHPDEAVERVRYLLGSTKAVVVHTTRRWMNRLTEAGVPNLDASVWTHPTLSGVIFLDDLVVKSKDATPPLPIHDCSPQDLAYLVHTSGSTGTPKGVCISHAAFENAVKAMLLPEWSISLQTFK